MIVIILCILVIFMSVYCWCQQAEIRTYQKFIGKLLLELDVVSKLYRSKLEGNDD